MVVDDSVNDIELIRRCFRQLNIANPIKTCTGADEAISYIERFDSPIITLLDLKMPGRDGFYVLNHIKTDPRWRDLVVIVLTASSSEGDIRLAYELGANSFLVKPVDLTVFKEMIEAFHSYWIVHAQPAPSRGRMITPEEAA